MLVSGQSGTGKSYFVKKYLLPKLATQKPVIVFDVLGEYAGQRAKDVPKNWKSYSSFSDFLESVKDSKVIKKEVHVIAWKTHSDVIQGIKFFRKLEKPVSLVFEEMHSLFTNPELKKAVDEPITQLTMYGRHFEIDCILITQRPKNIPTNLRSQIPFAVSFAQTLGSDIDSLEEITDGVGKFIVELPKYNYYAFGERPKLFNEIKLNQTSKL